MLHAVKVTKTFYVTKYSDTIQFNQFLHLALEAENMDLNKSTPDTF